MTTVPQTAQRTAPSDPLRDLFSLDGKTALVTGASKNIGLQIATLFAHAGANVVIVARTQRLLEERADEVRELTGAEVTAVTCDISEPSSVSDLTDRVLADIGTPDVLVNNAYAAGNRTADVLDITDADWEQVLETNLLGPYRLTARFGRAMRERGSGSIINLLSGAAFNPRSRAMAYGASKAALWAATQYLASNLAPQVRVNAIVPGLVMDETGGPEGDDLAARYLPHTPMGRVGHPREIAPAALYLASDASAYVTGAMLPVTGGRY